MSADEPARNPRRILIVDDESHIRRLLATRLEAEGYEVDEACDGEEGLAAVERRPPDLVLLDVMMPGADGYEVLERIRRGGHDLPVVILTAKGQEQDRDAAIDRGATGFVTKPFSPIKLLAMIRDLLDA